MGNMSDEKSLAVIEGQAPVPMCWDDALNVAQIRGRLDKIKNIVENVLEEGIEKDYAIIPGTKKKSLLQPGAQIINVAFHLVPRYQIKWNDLPRNHKEADVLCSLYHAPTNSFIGEGVGVCSTMESKYRYRNAERVCPLCGIDAIIKGQAQYGGGWVCWKKRNGCNSKFPENDIRILEQKVGKVEYDDPADYYNTVAKIAAKRAYIAATINATAASRYVTQDIGDPETDIDGAPIENHDNPASQGDAPPVGQSSPPKQEPSKPDIYAIITFGKYKGETWASLGQTTDGRKYLHWVTEPDKATGKVKYPESAAQARAALDKWKAQEQEPPSGVLEGEIPADPDNFINQ